MKIPPAGNFTKRCWQQAEPIYRRLIASDFIVGLANGTLASSSFGHYLQQDVIYLKHDNEAFARLSLRAETQDEQAFFEQIVTDGIEMEQVIRTSYLNHYGLKEAKTLSPAFECYCNFLHQQSSNSLFGEAAAALLPCFWIYGAVGMHVVEHNVPNNPYQLFIDTYAGDEYNDFVTQYIAIVEKHGAKATTEEQQLIVNAFVEGTLHELRVFEEAIQF
jgi:thiaminase/transcriptional activator TenA